MRPESSEDVSRLPLPAQDLLRDLRAYGGIGDDERRLVLALTEDAGKSDDGSKAKSTPSASGSSQNLRYPFNLLMRFHIEDVIRLLDRDEMIAFREEIERLPRWQQDLASASRPGMAATAFVGDSPKTMSQLLELMSEEELNELRDIVRTLIVSVKRDDKRYVRGEQGFVETLESALRSKRPTEEAVLRRESESLIRESLIYTFVKMGVQP